MNEYLKKVFPKVRKIKKIWYFNKKFERILLLSEYFWIRTNKIVNLEWYYRIKNTKRTYFFYIGYRIGYYEPGHPIFKWIYQLSALFSDNNFSDKIPHYIFMKFDMKNIHKNSRLIIKLYFYREIYFNSVNIRIYIGNT